MNTLDSRNPHAPRIQSTLDSRNPHALALQTDPRWYVSQTPYAEYPKWIELADGTGVTVNDEAEERVARGDDEELGAEFDSPVLPEGVKTPRRGPPSKAEREARAAAAQAALDKAAE